VIKVILLTQQNKEHLLPFNKHSNFKIIIKYQLRLQLIILRGEIVLIGWKLISYHLFQVLVNLSHQGLGALLVQLSLNKSK